jgi:hypothetical protein
LCNVKKLIIIPAILFLCSCSDRESQVDATVDSLKSEIKEMRELYRPGLGEIMSGVQMHHAKLWFAAMNENWQLADYEIKELEERLLQAKEMETNRPEIKSITMINPYIDSVSYAIDKKNLPLFVDRFKLLTKGCNDCHMTNNFGFNVVIIPTSLPVSNQEFKALSSASK